MGVSIASSVIELLSTLVDEVERYFVEEMVVNWVNCEREKSWKTEEEWRSEVEAGVEEEYSEAVVIKVNVSAIWVESVIAVKPEGVEESRGEDKGEGNEGSKLTEDEMVEGCEREGW